MADSNRLAIVTGTSSGIGAALAEALLAEGWAVIGLSRRKAVFESRYYRHLTIDLADLSKLEAIANAQIEPAFASRHWRRIGLVNNAALSGSKRGLEETDPTELANIFLVNTVAPVYLMGFVTRVVHAGIPLRIVNISSGAAVQAYPGIGDYSASKAALRMAGMALAAELDSPDRPGGQRDDVCILSYEPGVVDTAMQEEARSTTSEEFPWHQPFRDFYEQGMLEDPEDVVDDIVDFLDQDHDETFIEARFGE